MTETLRKNCAVLIIVCCFLTLVQSENDCSRYFQFINDYDEVQGLITMPIESLAEHRLKIVMTVAAQLSSVGPKIAW
jgi:hypothetical protein